MALARLNRAAGFASGVLRHCDWPGTPFTCHSACRMASVREWCSLAFTVMAGSGALMASYGLVNIGRAVSSPDGQRFLREYWEWKFDNDKA